MRIHSAKSDARYRQSKMYRGNIAKQKTRGKYKPCKCENFSENATLSAEQLYWILEPNDYLEKAWFRVAISNRVDRVLVHLSSDGQLVSWVTPDLLQLLDLSDSEAEATAFKNLERALSEATLETRDVDGVALGFIATDLPFKAALILAPNLKKVIGAELGWPLLAVTPDRDFLYLWAARHSDFGGRLGHLVVREYSEAPYPVTTEIFELSDHGIRAIGAFSACR